MRAHDYLFGLSLFIGSLTSPCIASGQTGSSPRLALHTCDAPATHKSAKCGAIVLPEDRAKPGGRTVRLAVLILPATDTRAKLEPIVFLHGGPGMPASRADDYVSFALGPEQRHHDLVMVDMRGTGGDAALTCDLYGDGRTLAPYLAPMFPLNRVRECAARLSARADLTQYTTENAAHDLDDVRAALGVPKWSLFGGSYGTRLALVYMRLFPERVQRAALLGVLPPDSPTGREFARGGEQALDSAFVSCARDASCRRRAPDARHDVMTLLDKLRRAPETLTIHHQTYVDSEQVTLTARAAAEALFIAAYYPPQLVRMLPLVHDAVASGDLHELAKQFAELSRSKRNGRAVGLALSVWCAEDIPRLSAADTQSSRSPLGIPVLAEITAACHEWPHATVSTSYGARVSSSIPTLLMSGGRDPATPAYLADSAAKGLSRAERYHDPAAGHAALDGRARDRMARFFDAARR